MKPSRLHALLRFVQRALALLLLWALALAGSGAGSFSVQARPAEDAEPLFTRYLPLVIRDRLRTPFGIEPIWISQGNYPNIQSLKPYWLRYSAFNWNAIEPTLESPRRYNWNAVDEAGLKLVAGDPVNIIATIKYTPTWAQKIPGITCGPVAADRLDEFATFVETLVARYSRPPYNIQYWELGNEPDVDPGMVTPDHPFGCWGDYSDPYYGGGYYAEMLKQVYPAIKRANPNAQVILGGLLMGCDPDVANAADRCKSTRFIDGILRNQGGNYLDIIAFHSYPFYAGGVVVDETHNDWQARGGIVNGKIAYLRQVMARYNVALPLLLDEIALACPVELADCRPPGAKFFDVQANYIVQVNARIWSEGLLGTVWYSLDDTGWQNVALITTAGPRPAYYSLQFMATELYGARLNKSVTHITGIQGYEYMLADRLVWLLWSTDGLAHSVTIPATTLRVLDKFGAALTPQNGRVSVNAPTYIEFTP